MDAPEQQPAPGGGGGSEGGRSEGVAAQRSATARRAAHAVRRGAAATGRVTARGSVAGARWVGRGTTGSARRFRRFARADGADESGLDRLTELHAVTAAADAAFAVALAGTVLALPVDQARGQVALFLVTTMVPFVVLAPFVGPLLDRFRHGRRWAIGTTLALRAFLSWVLAGLVVDDSGWLLPVALLCLLAARAYVIARSAAIPLVLPQRITLVAANSRQSIASVLGMVVGSLAAVPVSRIGAEWALRLAFLVYVAATVQAIRLPARVDSVRPGAAEVAAGTVPPTMPIPLGTDERAGHGGTAAAASPDGAVTAQKREGIPSARRAPRAGGGFRLRREATPALPVPVRATLVAATSARVLSGFVTFFLAFLLREHPVDGVSSVLAMGLVVVAAGVGNAVGSFAGNRLGHLSPHLVTAASLLVVSVTVLLATVRYGMVTLLLLGLVTGAFGQLARVCLDAAIQDDVPEHWQARVFSRVETRLQAAWVAGGAGGIATPLVPWVGFGAMTVLLAATVGRTVWLRHSGRRQP